MLTAIEPRHRPRLHGGRRCSSRTPASGAARRWERRRPRPSAPPAPAAAVGPLVAHASYLINLCSPDPALLARSREALADELTRCARLGVDGLVLHPGAHLGAGEEAGIDGVAASLDAVLAALPERPHPRPAGEHGRPGLLPGLPPGAPGRDPRPGWRAPAGRRLPRHLPRLRGRLCPPRGRGLRGFPGRDRGAARPRRPGLLPPQRLAAPLRFKARPPRPHRRGRDRPRPFARLLPTAPEDDPHGRGDRARRRHGGHRTGPGGAAGAWAEGTRGGGPGQFTQRSMSRLTTLFGIAAGGGRQVLEQLSTCGRPRRPRRPGWPASGRRWRRPTTTRAGAAVWPSPAATTP